jgi:lipoprotein-anchoring transpeptidase ErfK/SrfK
MLKIRQTTLRVHSPSFQILPRWIARLSMLLCGAWAAPGSSLSNGEVVMRILSKVLVVCVTLVAGCAADRNAAMNQSISQGSLAQQGTENGDEISYWDGAGSGGEPRIVIDLDQQRAYFYKGDQIVGVSAVSTGREGYDTPAGEFRIMEKDREHVSSLS